VANTGRRKTRARPVRYYTTEIGNDHPKTARRSECPLLQKQPPSRHPPDVAGPGFRDTRIESPRHRKRLLDLVSFSPYL